MSLKLRYLTSMVGRVTKISGVDGSLAVGVEVQQDDHQRSVILGGNFVLLLRPMLLCVMMHFRRSRCLLSS